MPRIGIITTMEKRRRRQLAAKSARRIHKSPGVTPTENLLADLCDRSFLRLWSFPNPYRDDGHELCDVIAAFDNHLFVFFDRSKKLDLKASDDPLVTWERWRRNVIDKQVKTALGAVRYLSSGRRVFIDAQRQTELPVQIDPSQTKFHKIIVAHGAEQAVRAASERNLNGSLAIEYSSSATNHGGSVSRGTGPRPPHTVR